MDETSSADLVGETPSVGRAPLPSPGFLGGARPPAPTRSWRGLVGALALLTLALLALWPAAALAAPADEPALTVGTIVNTVLSLLTGGVLLVVKLQADRNRKAEDEAEKRRQEQSDAIGLQLTEARSARMRLEAELASVRDRLQGTREEYARQTEVQALRHYLDGRLDRMDDRLQAMATEQHATLAAVQSLAAKLGAH